jgi:hypothetical protein
VPLDKDVVWKVNGSSIALPPSICARIDSGQALGIVASKACPTKNATMPACGPASAVASSSTAGGGSDAAAAGTADFEPPVVSKRTEALLSDVAVDDQNVYLARAQPQLPAGVIRLKKTDITDLKQPEDFQVLFSYDAGVEERSRIVLDPASSAQHVVARGQSGDVRVCPPGGGSCSTATVAGPTYRALAAGASEAYAFGSALSVTGLFALPFTTTTPEQRIGPPGTGVTALLVKDDSVFIGLDDASLYRCVIPCKTADQLTQIRTAPTKGAAITTLAASDKVPGKIFFIQLPLAPPDPEPGGVFVLDLNGGAEARIATSDELAAAAPTPDPPSALAVDAEYVYWGGGFDDPRDHARKGGLLRRSHLRMTPTEPFLEPTQGAEPASAVTADGTHVFWTYYRADRSLVFAKKTRSF